MRDLHVRTLMLPDIVVHRRIHERNNSLTNRANAAELLRALRDSVARKRAVR
jgi:hypothetical protein